jgi:RNA polymerase sigma-70 factor (ECF subfamily)
MPKIAPYVTQQRRRPARARASIMIPSKRNYLNLRYFTLMATRVDARALGELFRKHGPAVCRRAQRILCNHADAQEATQEVFLRALRSAERFEGRSQITTWLYQITTHHCLNQLRDRRRRRELMEEQFVAAESKDSAAISSSPAELILLRQLLAEAEEQLARAAIYVYLDELTHEEAAEVLGVSSRTVGNLIERFRAWAARRVAEKQGAGSTSAGPQARRRSP